jgi:hypothetical protein
LKIPSRNLPLSTVAAAAVYQRVTEEATVAASHK